MPPFNALAGLSPNCWAVRVQMEHCARKWSGTIKNSTSNNINIKLPLAIANELQHKSTTKNFYCFKYEISPFFGWRTCLLLIFSLQVQ
jgi:hypothetical protein